MSDEINLLVQRISALEDAVRRLTSGGSSPAPQAASVTPDEWRTLGDKLDRLESNLNDKEKAVLLTILGAAAASMDQGGGSREAPAAAASRVNLTGSLDKVRLSDGLMSIGRFDKGRLGGGIGPVADSVNVGGDFTSVHGDWSKDLKSADLANRGRWNAINTLGNQIQPSVDTGRFGFSGGGGFR